MVAYLFLGIALLVGFLLLARWYVQTEPKQILKVLRWTALVVGVAFVVFIFVSGRWNWLPAAAFAALPWINRLNWLRTMAKNARGPSRGQTSAIRTAFLNMELSHDTGTMTGQVVQGTYAGRPLASLQEPELFALLAECAADPQSAAVLESYLDRSLDADWRDRAGAAGASAGAGGGAGPTAAGPMSADEAREILGLDRGASEDDIENAYRRLMKQLHPDHGGSDWLAAKLNQAREVLLRG